MDAYGVFHLDGFLNSWHFPIFAMSSTFGPSVCFVGTWGEGRSIQRSPGDEGGGGTFGKGSNHWMEVELRRRSWLPFLLTWRIRLNVWRLREKCIIKKLPSWQLPSPPKKGKRILDKKSSPLLLGKHVFQQPFATDAKGYVCWWKLWSSVHGPMFPQCI